MKLSKLYADNDTIFEPIYFNLGINIILAEVRNPSNLRKSSHDLGKSLLAKLIDYCLLKEIKKGHFIKNNYDIFEEMIFFLEISLDDNSYFTIKRPVKKGQKIMIKQHIEPHQNYNELEDRDWDFIGNIGKGKEYVNKLLSFDVLANRNYRSCLGYFLRNDESYSDLFKLSSFGGPDKNWKPALLELLGFKSKYIIEKYDIDTQISKNNEDIKKLTKANEDKIVEKEKLKTLICIKENDLENKSNLYNNFNFVTSDIKKPKKLVEEIDIELKNLINENYYLLKQIKNAKESIIDYNVNLDELETFYNEIGLYFENQLKKEYTELIIFNNELTKERNDILREIIKEGQEKYDINNKRIEELNLERSKYLEYLNYSNTMDKYKNLQNEIVDLKAKILNLKDKLENFDDASKIDLSNQQLEVDRTNIVFNMNKEIFGKENSCMNNIKKHFSYIINTTLGDLGIITLFPNKQSNINFKAEIIDSETNYKGNKGDGTTYKKLMCAAFDLAILATYYKSKYFHFVYHDGIFDGLDDRQKNNFYKIIEEYTKKYSIQHIFTVIQDELPTSIKKNDEISKLKDNKTIIKVLHDDGNNGRLFNMNPF
ncbi:DUF2326 domain-containing protein [Clostridium botulinum]|uniref:DUF2326 domain-containing protein n=1 Tax=Clostridium botulinum (strain Langeland / NCTC 10281 / Type F) TaxID=441772 RepID=A7GEF2_CLOBL|nr:DUF2326 domain-containing protein [Clostridium botulinum]ABS41077.1 conserved hypothetical protein [Clostridium botulinum F str. Langeland]ADF99580.1 conserved hypothetical protein [Clostridium botulinum F str. 230613]KKM42842.1 hypothetical protein VT72_04165 [Clostridium botulinum]MBY6791638.1 DUF2326 domain-containing protein [Clostridium botulinum]MBY6936874.1 DUF2326 domain-containing protein [Clostridium botulinum]